jgi:Transglycosylase SLT domain
MLMAAVRSRFGWTVGISLDAAPLAVVCLPVAIQCQATGELEHRSEKSAMSLMTLEALRILLQTHTCVVPAMVPIILARAQVENPTLDTTSNGTIDAGLMQINSINWTWTGLLTPADRFDPCKSAHAAQMVEFRNYNGNPPPLLRDSYVARTTTALSKISATAPELIIPLARPPPVHWNPFSRPQRMGNDSFYVTKREK